jgi:hypothetical protein
MGITFSQILLGFHTLLELAAGSPIYANGKVSPKMDPEESKKDSPRDKVWKRWHASGLLAMAYVGYIGLKDDGAKTPAVEACTLFHSLCAGVSFLAWAEGTMSLKEATVGNVHLHLALGFGAVRLGLMS